MSMGLVCLPRFVDRAGGCPDGSSAGYAQIRLLGL